MSSAVSPSARRPARAPRPSLSATVLRLTAVALVAAVLVWSVLLLGVLRKRTDSGASLGSQSTGQLSAPDGGQSAQAPAPVITRTS